MSDQLGEPNTSDRNAQSPPDEKKLAIKGLKRRASHTATKSTRNTLAPPTGVKSGRSPRTPIAATKTPKSATATTPRRSEADRKEDLFLIPPSMNHRFITNDEKIFLT